MLSLELPEWRHAHSQVCLADGSIVTRCDHFLALVIAFKGCQDLAFLVDRELLGFFLASATVPHSDQSVLMG